MKKFNSDSLNQMAKEIGGIYDYNKENYQCGFSTLRIAWEAVIGVLSDRVLLYKISIRLLLSVMIYGS